MTIKRKTMKISDTIQIDNDNVARTKIFQVFYVEQYTGFQKQL